MKNFLLLLLAWGVLPIHAQTVKEATLAFLQEAGENAALYRGKLDKPYNKRLNANLPYLYGDEEFRKGDISFQGILYPNVPIRVDLYSNTVAVIDPNGKKQIVPEQSKIDYFTIGEEKYVPYKGNFTRESFAGRNMTLYTELKCVTDFTLQTGKVAQTQYALKVHSFLHRGGTDHPVSKLKDLQRLFPEQAAEIKRFAKTNHLRFNKEERESSLIAIVEHLDSKGL